MSQKTRRKIDAALSAKIALHVLREQATVADLFQYYGVHVPTARPPNCLSLARSYR